MMSKVSGEWTGTVGCMLRIRLPGLEAHAPHRLAGRPVAVSGTRRPLQAIDVPARA